MRGKRILLAESNVRPHRDDSHDVLLMMIDVDLVIP
jgi:hypothetical protein